MSHLVKQLNEGKNIENFLPYFKRVCFHIIREHPRKQSHARNLCDRLKSTQITTNTSTTGQEGQEDEKISVLLDSLKELSQEDFTILSLREIDVLKESTQDLIEDNQGTISCSSVKSNLKKLGQFLLIVMFVVTSLIALAESLVKGESMWLKLAVFNNFMECLPSEDFQIKVDFSQDYDLPLTDSSELVSLPNNLLEKSPICDLQKIHISEENLGEKENVLYSESLVSLTSTPFLINSDLEQRKTLFSSKSLASLQFQDVPSLEFNEILIANESLLATTNSTISGVTNFDLAFASNSIDVEVKNIPESSNPIGLLVVSGVFVILTKRW